LLFVLVMVLEEMKERPHMTQREQLVYLAWVAEEADRYDDALDALSQLVDLEQLEDHPTDTWAWEDVNLVVDATIRLIEEEVRPMVWVASNVLFEERMVVERMGPLRHTTADTQFGLSYSHLHGMRVRVASTLHQRAQARMERLCAQCMRLLDQAVDHDDIAAALAHQPTDNYMAEEWASLYYRMHVSLLLPMCTSMAVQQASRAGRETCSPTRHSARAEMRDQPWSPKHSRPTRRLKRRTQARSVALLVDAGSAPWHARLCTLTYVCARSVLSDVHPLKVKMWRSVSVFYYDQLGLRLEAIGMLHAAFNAAIAKLDCIDEETYRQVTILLQDLHDRLRRWTAIDIPPQEPGTCEDQVGDALALSCITATE
jgi:hypothetical protein